MKVYNTLENGFQEVIQETLILKINKSGQS